MHQSVRDPFVPVLFQTVSLERLSGNSERASFRGPKSPHEGAKWHNFRRSALPRKARSDPFRYFPDSLSRKLSEQTPFPLYYAAFSLASVILRATIGEIAAVYAISRPSLRARRSGCPPSPQSSRPSS